MRQGLLELLKKYPPRSRMEPGELEVLSTDELAYAALTYFYDLTPTAKRRHEVGEVLKNAGYLDEEDIPIISSDGAMGELVADYQLIRSMAGNKRMFAITINHIGRFTYEWTKHPVTSAFPLSFRDMDIRMSVEKSTNFFIEDVLDIQSTSVTKRATITAAYLLARNLAPQELVFDKAHRNFDREKVRSYLSTLSPT